VVLVSHVNRVPLPSKVVKKWLTSKLGGGTIHPMQRIYARQGDLNINPTNEYPTLAPATAPVVVAGSHEGAHSLPAGALYARDGSRHYAMLPEGGQLVHSSRHRPVPLEPGVTYEIWPEIERHGEHDEEVAD
jgi:hypothetical protein